jgi:hypothetical protein
VFSAAILAASYGILGILLIVLVVVLIIYFIRRA